MTIAEILKANGVGDEAIAAIQAAMKENKIYTAGEENLDIRYGKLKTQHESTAQQLTEANALIAELKKGTKGQEGLQQKVSEYEAQVKQLQNELAKTQLDAEIKVQLLGAKALDVDYMTFKLKEKGELSLDENGKIKGWDDKLAGLKTQFPMQFEASDTKRIVENKLPDREHGNEGAEPKSLEDALKLAYEPKKE